MALSEKTIEVIERTIKSIRGRQHMPGVGVGIVRGKELVYAKGFGDAILEDETPVTPDTVFRIASISKVLTSIGVQKLAAAGHFDLDDPINQHLKSFQIRPRKATDPSATIREILTHQAGLGELTPLINYLHPGAFFGMGRVGKPLLPVSKFYVRTPQSDARPRSKWAYSNPGFSVLGQLIADTTDMHYAEAMRHLIFDPLDMRRSDFVRSDRVQPGLAAGYGKKDSWREKRTGMRKRAMDLEILTMADGSLFTTVEDFSKFVRAMINQGEGLVSADLLSRMYTTQHQLDERLPSVGLGIFLENPKDWNGHQVVQHDGSWLGFTSSMYLAPDEGWGVYAFTNCGASAIITMAHSIMRTLLKAPYQRPEPAPASKDVRPELIGSYGPIKGFNSNFRVWTGYGAKLTVYQEKDQLKIKSRLGAWRKGINLHQVDANDPLVCAAGGRKIIFQRDENQKINRIALKFKEFYKQ